MYVRYARRTTCHHQEASEPSSTAPISRQPGWEDMCVCFQKVKTHELWEKRERERESVKTTVEKISALLIRFRCILTRACATVVVSALFLYLPAACLQSFARERPEKRAYFAMLPRPFPARTISSARG